MKNNNNIPNPMNSMPQGSQNVHVVTLNGQTKTVSGAFSSDHAARQAFGNDWNRATTQTTQTKKWF
jgi:hypothetical protein